MRGDRNEENNMTINAEGVDFRRLNEFVRAETECEIENCLGQRFIAAGTDGKTYGSVTSKEIAEKLLEQAGIEVDKRKIDIPEPIKTFGTYRLDVKLYGDIGGKINVVVTEK